MSVRKFCKAFRSTERVALVALLASVALPHAVAQSDSDRDRALIETITVTAEKRESTVQDTPIAVSAFDEKALETANISNTREIQFSVPNTLYSKTNFTGANLVIRGIGNNAIAQSSDSGAGVHFNNAYQVASNLFEADYYDVERVEILRGPQGTLYGRNTTAGVLNIIPNKPSDEFDASGSFEGGDYNERKLSAAVNVNLFPSFFQFRGAVYSAERDGVVYNQATDTYVDDRDIKSFRFSARIGASPTSPIDLTFFRAHFEEEDTRMRTSKQLCHRQTDLGFPHNLGCSPNKSLYDQENVYGTPVSYSTLAGWLAAAFGLAPAVGATALTSITDSATPPGINPGYMPTPYTDTGFGPGRIGIDLNATANNPEDLRAINATFNPYYFAEEDIEHIDFKLRLSDSATISVLQHDQSNTQYTNTDYNWTRGPESSAFPDGPLSPGGILFVADPNPIRGKQKFNPNADTQLAAWDVSAGTSNSEVSEIRFSTDSSGAFNILLGSFELDFESEGWYEVHANTLQLTHALTGGSPFDASTAAVRAAASAAERAAARVAAGLPLATADELMEEAAKAAAKDTLERASAFNCPVVSPDNNRTPNCDALGFFRSHTERYTLTSSAQFAEIYIGGSNVRFTLGARMTEEEKEVSDRQTLLNASLLTPVDGVTGRSILNSFLIDRISLLDDGRVVGWTGAVGGNPAAEAIEANQIVLYNPSDDTVNAASVLAAVGQDWRLGFGSGTGALGNDAIPNFAQRGGMWNEPTGRIGLDFYVGERSLLYFSASNSYKSGGLNPPAFSGAFAATFGPEYVDAFEMGLKTASDRALFNLTFFMYEYEGLQISKIVDRTAVNENVDAEIFGAELEFSWAMSKNWIFSMQGSYLSSEILTGRSINVADPANYYRDGTETPRFLNTRNNGADVFTVENPASGYNFKASDCGTAMEGGYLVCADIFVVNPYDLFVQSTDTSETETDPGTGTTTTTYVRNYMRDDFGRTVLVDVANRPTQEVLDALRTKVPIGIEVELAGNQLPSAPKSSLTLSWTYRFDLDGNDGRFRLDYYWQDEYYYRVYNTEQDLIRPWEVYNASFAVTAPDGSWEIEIWGKNLADKDYITGGYFTDATSGNFTNVFLLEPRTVGASFNLRY